MTPPVGSLCIHGWGTSPAIWGTIFDEVPPAPDLTVAKRADELVDAVVTAANDLATETLIGWSLGGMLALAAAPRIPTLRRFVLIGSGPAFVRDDGGGWSVAVIERMQQALRRQPEAVRRHFFERHLPGQALPTCADEPEALLAGLAFLARQKLNGVAAGLAMPVLWLHGAEDSLFSPPTANEAQRLMPQATLTYHCYNGLGHAPFLEDPERCRRDLSTFLLQS